MINTLSCWGFTQRCKTRHRANDVTSSQDSDLSTTNQDNYDERPSASCSKKVSNVHLVSSREVGEESTEVHLVNAA